MQKTYDLIVSLGGSCLAAKQAELRGLRLCSLPLDWLAYNGTEQIPSLTDLFKKDFEYFLKLDELVELSAEEKGDSAKFQVKSTRTGFAFIHDFKTNILDKNNHDRLVQFEAVKISMPGASRGCLIYLRAQILFYYYWIACVSRLYSTSKI